VNILVLLIEEERNHSGPAINMSPPTYGTSLRPTHVGRYLFSDARGFKAAMTVVGYTTMTLCFDSCVEVIVGDLNRGNCLSNLDICRQILRQWPTESAVLVNVIHLQRDRLVDW